MKNFKHWQVFDELPLGWVIDKSAGSPLHGHEFCSNGKSILNGGARALVRAFNGEVEAIPAQPIGTPKNTEPKTQSKPVVVDAAYAMTVNELARQRFKLKILSDIRCDLMICELEGWCKREYINDIREMINGIKI